MHTEHIRPPAGDIVVFGAAIMIGAALIIYFEARASKRQNGNGK